MSRKLTTEEELDALKEGAVLVCLNERTNPRYPTIFLKIKDSGYLPWMEMEPSDRDDGEYGTTAKAILLYSATKSCELVWEPTP